MARVEWSKIEADWHQREKDPITGWHEHFVQNRGYESIAQARAGLIKTLKLNQRDWFEVELENPIEEVAEMYPNVLIPTVKKMVTNRLATPFQALAMHPYFTEHKKVQGIIENPPAETTLITLKGRMEDGQERRVVIDGLHRGAAIPRMSDYPGKVFLHEGVVSDEKEFSYIFNAHPSFYYSRLAREIFTLIRGRFKKMMN